MAYFEKTGIFAADTPSADAFGRWRISSPQTLFDSKLLTSASLDTYWSQRTWGNATSSYNVYESYVSMSINNVSGSRCINQTKRRFVYEPGKSLLIIMTGQFLTGVAGIEKHITYGDDYYALGFCQSGSSFGVVKRNTTSTGTTTTFVSQSAWNLDTFDGNGPSGKTYDPTKCQIHFLDMEWLGVGRVRMGIFQGGAATYVHQFSHANELVSTYIGNPNLPVRYEITNKIGSASPSSMKHICCSVQSEGGSENLGVQQSIDNGGTSISVNNSHAALVLLRQITASAADGWKGNAPRITPSETNIVATGTTDLRWTLQVNPIIATSASLTWTRNGLSSAEYATGSATTLITTQGKVIGSGYIPGSTTPQGASRIIGSQIDPFFSLGEDLFGKRDVLALTVQELEGSANACYGSLIFKEVL